MLSLEKDRRAGKKCLHRAKWAADHLDDCFGPSGAKHLPALCTSLGMSRPPFAGTTFELVLSILCEITEDYPIVNETLLGRNDARVLDDIFSTMEEAPRIILKASWLP